MAGSNSSIMIVVVMIIGMVMSSVMSAGAGLVGYSQGWFDDFFGTDPPSSSSESADGGSGNNDDEDTEEKSSIPTGKSIYLYSKNCGKGTNWHRFVSARSQDETQPWMHCKKEGDYTVWTLEKTATWYYYIKNKKTGKYLTETTTNGIRTIKISEKDGDKSRWAIKKQSDAENEYVIRNKSSSKVLNIHGNDCSDWDRSTVDGESVIRLDDVADEKNAADSARWKIAQPAYTAWTKIVPSSEANCKNER